MNSSILETIMRTENLFTCTLLCLHVYQSFCFFNIINNPKNGLVNVFVSGSETASISFLVALELLNRVQCSVKI